MFVALALGHGHSLTFISLVLQHDDPARGLQHSFGGHSPMLVSDLDHIGHHMVGDVLLSQNTQKTLHLGRRWCLALALQPIQSVLGHLALPAHLVPTPFQLALALFQLTHTFGQLCSVVFHGGQRLKFIGTLNQVLCRTLGISGLLLGALGVGLLLLQFTDQFCSSVFRLQQLQ